MDGIGVRKTVLIVGLRKCIESEMVWHGMLGLWPADMNGQMLLDEGFPDTGRI